MKCLYKKVFLCFGVASMCLFVNINCSGNSEKRSTMSKGDSRSNIGVLYPKLTRLSNAKKSSQQCRLVKQNQNMQHDSKTGLTWIKIPGGSYQMGSIHGEKNERPVHRVTVGTFWMTKTEVTVAQYRKCVEDDACQVPDNPISNPQYAIGCNWGVKGRDDHPVNCVLWKWAKQYAKWARARLPSEAEWEYAARSLGKRKKYPWGSAKPTTERAVMSHIGKLSDNSKCYDTCPVCSRSKKGNTEQGLCDMAGNAMEWVEDSYHPSYSGAPTDGAAWVAKGAQFRVSRGGAFSNGPNLLRTTARVSGSIRSCSTQDGFRLVKDASK